MEIEGTSWKLERYWDSWEDAEMSSLIKTFLQLKWRFGDSLVRKSLDRIQER